MPDQHSRWNCGTKNNWNVEILATEAYIPGDRREIKQLSTLPTDDTTVPFFLGMSAFANKIHTPQSQSHILVFPIPECLVWPTITCSINAYIINRWINECFAFKEKRADTTSKNWGGLTKKVTFELGLKCENFFERINWNAIGSVWKGFLGKWNYMKIYF